MRRAILIHDRRRHLWFLAAAVACASQAHAQAPAADQTPAAPPGDDDVSRLYSLRRFRRAWNDKTAAIAIAAMQNAEAEGLKAEDYALDSEKPTHKNTAASWDVQLSTTFLRYARDLRTGRIAANEAYADVDLPPQDFDAPEELNNALKNDALERFLAALAPQRPEYAFLRDALARYRTQDPRARLVLPAGEATALPAAAQRRIWSRLAEDQPDLSVDAFSAEALDGALRAFQARHGMEADGVIGSKTLAALNMPPTARVQQIIANMERWRWMPHKAEPRYLEVNAASATLDAFNDGRIVLHSPVVLGRRDWKTPLLATTIAAVILNPPWPIPGSIARMELLPKLVQNRQYLAKNDMVLLNGPKNDPHGLRINWRKVSARAFPYEIQQQPGARNALGAFLLDMPNRFDVYLHDTPAQSLFEESERYFSHGCVRVQKVSELASFVLLGDTGAPIAEREALARDESVRLPLPEPMTAYFSYWTAFKGEDGAIAFRNDVYGRDARLIALLNRPRT